MKQYFPALDPPKNRPQPVYFYPAELVAKVLKNSEASFEYFWKQGRIFENFIFIEKHG